MKGYYVVKITQRMTGIYNVFHHQDIFIANRHLDIFGEPDLAGGFCFGAITGQTYKVNLNRDIQGTHQVSHKNKSAV